MFTLFLISALEIESQNHEKILFLEDFEDFSHRMDRFLFDMVRATINYRDLSVELWGPGFLGYNVSLSTNENILTRFPDVQFTIVYSSLNHYNFVSNPRTVSVVELGDCNDEECKSQVNINGNITSVRYAHEIFDMFGGNKFPDHINVNHSLVIHNADCVCLTLVPKLTDVDFNRKNVFASLMGVIRFPLYPLRSKISEAILAGQLKNVSIYKHPGYDVKLSEEDLNQLRELPLNESTNAMRKFRAVQVSFLTAMRKAWICIFDSSALHKTIRKYYEAMASGCAVAADIPYDFPRDGVKHIIELKPSWSVQKIDAVLSVYLNNLPMLEKRIYEAEKYAREHFSCHSKVKRLLEAVDGYRSGWRGYYFPQGYRVDCNYYMKGATVDHLHPWCKT